MRQQLLFWTGLRRFACVNRSQTEIAYSVAEREGAEVL